MNIYTYNKETVEELRKRYLAGEAIVADCHKLHNLLWLWLAENPGNITEGWPLWKYQGGWIDDDKINRKSFACAVTPLIIKDRGPGLKCSECPLDWGYFGGRWKKNCFNSYLGDWEKAFYSKAFDKARRLAITIAGLSWKGQEEFTIQKDGAEAVYNSYSSYFDLIQKNR